MKMKTALLLAGAIFAAGVAAQALAQTYPTKPVRMISPFSAGGGSSILGHMIASPVSEALGVPVIVDNRPGAGGAVGAEIAVRAEPDGYTLITVSASYCATSAYRRLRYDPVRDIQPIALIGTTGLLVVVHPSVPARNVKELVDYAKANPGKLNYASVGSGSVTHLSFELFKILTKTNMVHVPYKGSGPALTGVVGGETQITSLSMVPTIPHVKAGRLRALAITSPKRSALLPDVPTVSETVPGYEVVHWYGTWGPKGIPKRIVTRWNQEVNKVLQTDQMKKRLTADGLEPAGGPPEVLHDLIRRDVEKWTRVIKEAKIPRVG